QKADARVLVLPAAGHRERRREVAGGDEAELPRRVRVPAAGDDDVPEPLQRGLTRRPVGERQQWVARASGAVLGSGPLIGRGAALGLRQLLRLAAVPRRGGEE